RPTTRGSIWPAAATRLYGGDAARPRRPRRQDRKSAAPGPARAAASRWRGGRVRRRGLPLVVAPRRDGVHRFRGRGARLVFLKGPRMPSSDRLRRLAIPLAAFLVGLAALGVAAVLTLAPTSRPAGAANVGGP